MHCWVKKRSWPPRWVTTSETNAWAANSRRMQARLSRFSQREREQQVRPQPHAQHGLCSGLWQHRRFSWSALKDGDELRVIWKSAVASPKLSAVTGAQRRLSYEVYMTNGAWRQACLWPAWRLRSWESDSVHTSRDWESSALNQQSWQPGFGGLVQSVRLPQRRTSRWIGHFRPRLSQNQLQRWPTTATLCKPRWLIAVESSAECTIPRKRMEWHWQHAVSLILPKRMNQAL